MKDDAVFRAYSLMDSDERPIATYHEVGRPLITERLRRMDDAFCEFGIDCYRD